MLDFDILDTVAGKQLWDEAKEKGKEEGLEIGIGGMAEMLLMNVKVRFGTISPEVENKIKSIKNIDKIRELFTQSFSCDYEHQFKQLLE